MKKVHWLPLAALAVLFVGCASSEYSEYDAAADEVSNTAFAAGESEGLGYGQDNGGIAGFNNSDRNGSADMAQSPNVSQANSVPPLNQMSTVNMSQQLRQIIRNGEISLRVDDVRKTARQITDMVVQGGGYVQSTKTNDVAGDNPTVDMSIRVVSSGFDDAMMTLEDMGVLLEQSSNTQDVTAQLVDLGARVKTLIAKEDTFREMLRNARSTSDIISLQERLTQVRTEIERMEAQRKSLSALASLSTIEVHLSENATIPIVASDPNWFGQNFAAASTSFMGIGRGFVSMLTWLVVFSPVWLTPILVGSWAWKRFGKRIPPVTH